jgi:hypothetical protein
MSRPTHTLERLRRALGRNRSEQTSTYERRALVGPTHRATFWKRLTALLTQIFFLKKKEVALLVRIEDVEKRHREMRRLKKLRRITPDLLAQHNAKEKEKREEETAAFWLFVLWDFFRAPLSPKKKTSEPEAR